MWKASCLRSPTTSKAEPSLISTRSSLGVWSIVSSPMNSSVPSASSAFDTRTRPAGSGMPMLLRLAFLNER